MNRKYIVFCVIIAAVIIPAVLISASIVPGEPTAGAVYIVYGSEKGDLSYTDAAYKGLLEAQNDFGIVIREFTPLDYESLPAILKNSSGAERPGLIITVGFQYADFTRELADENKDIFFLAIDQSGIGSENLRSYEITSYGDSFLSGVLAASATNTGRVGIIMGMQSDVLDTFLRGYSDGVFSINPDVTVENAYVNQNSTEGFNDPEKTRRIADLMYQNGTDVLFMCAGYSNMGAFNLANDTLGLYIIGTDSDQSPLGPEFVLASAVKWVDTVVYNGISEYLGGSFTGGNVVAGLKDGVNGLLFNPKFEEYNKTVGAWEITAEEEEEAKYLQQKLFS